jgi:hypothetical protein
MVSGHRKEFDPGGYAPSCAASMAKCRLGEEHLPQCRKAFFLESLIDLEFV